MGLSCYLKLMKFTRAQVKLTRAQALVGPGVDTPLDATQRLSACVETVEGTSFVDN